MAFLLHRRFEPAEAQGLILSAADAAVQAVLRLPAPKRRRQR